MLLREHAGELAPQVLAYQATMNKPTEMASKRTSFVVVRTGDLMLMPGMPKRSAAQKIGLDADGNIVGLS